MISVETSPCLTFSSPHTNSARFVCITDPGPFCCVHPCPGYVHILVSVFLSIQVNSHSLSLRTPWSWWGLHIVTTTPWLSAPRQQVGDARQVLNGSRRKVAKFLAMIPGLKYSLFLVNPWRRCHNVYSQQLVLYSQVCWQMGKCKVGLVYKSS